MSTIPAGYKQTEVGTIPKEWEVMALGEIGDVRMCKRVLKQQTRDHGDVPFYKIGTFGDAADAFISCSLFDEFKRKYSFPKKGDVLISAAGTIGRTVVYDGAPAYFQDSNIVWIENDESKTTNVYLWHCYQVTKWAVSHGGTVARLYNDNLRTKIHVPVPPLPEQRAIAAALSDVDALLAKLDQLIAKKRDLKQAAMQQLLTGQTRLPGFGAKHSYKKTEIGAIPEDWEVRPLLTAVRIAQGQADPKIEPYKSMVLVGPAHVESGTGKLIARQTAAEQGAISGKYLFSAGDIVYGKINPYLQKAFLADSSGLCSADMYPLKPTNDVVSGFMLAVILGRRFTKYAESVSVRSGMPKINRDEMGRFSFPLPSDKTEQTAIASVLSDMDAEIAALEARRDKTRALKQGMMQELLTGRIRLV